MILGWLRYDVLALDLLHILMHRTIDFGDLHDLFARDRTVRAGISADLRAVHGQLSTFQQPHLHTLLDDSLEKIEEERRLLKTAVPILGECRVMRNLLVEAEASEPAISQVHPDVLDRSAFTGDPVKVANQEDA